MTTVFDPRQSLVADMAGYIADAPEPEYTGCIIALIPADDDPIVAETSEPPHVTLVWMGDIADLQNMQGIIDECKAYASKLTPITVPVQGRDVFDGGADVVLLEPTDSLVAMRDGLLGESPAITTARDAVEQYPQWNPHVTLGYDDVNTSYSGDAVTFDKLGVWAGDDRFEYPLNASLTADGDDGWSGWLPWIVPEGEKRGAPAPAPRAASPRISSSGGGGNPQQARVPRGNGTHSGEWTDTARGLANSLGSLRLPGGQDTGVSGYHRRSLVDIGSAEMRERFRAFDAEGKVSSGKSAITRAYRQTGYDKTQPTLVDKLPPGSTPIYRGSPVGTQQFKTGDHYPGTGFYGNGSYFTADPKQGLSYGGGNPANVVTAAWKPDARVLDLKHMWPGGTFYDDDVDNHLATLNEKLGGTDYYNGELASSALHDLGATAALLGYDGIHITRPKGQAQDYDIVLNREATYVERESQ